MCLGIPGQVVELLASHEHLAAVDVSGVGRTVNIGLLEDEDVQPGDWVLIHVGFAMSKIDEERRRWRWPRCSSWARRTTTSSRRSGRRRSPQTAREPEVRAKASARAEGARR